MFSDRRGKFLCPLQESKPVEARRPLPLVFNPHIHTSLLCRFDRPSADGTRTKGGRTAWSSKVVVDGHCLAARYWYDGRYLNNAKEDVAEVAYLWLTTGS